MIGAPPCDRRRSGAPRRERSRRAGRSSSLSSVALLAVDRLARRHRRPARPLRRPAVQRQALPQGARWPSWGWMAPLVFIVIQALQVIISPIPGEITGPVGGALFGTAVGRDLLDDRPHRRHAGLLRSGPEVGRAAGAPVAQRAPLEPDELHHRGRGRDPLLHPVSRSRAFRRTSSRTCSGSARCPSGSSRWSSTVGAAARHLDLARTSAPTSPSSSTSTRIAFIALVTALCLPLYYYRDRIIRRFHRQGPAPPTLDAARRARRVPATMGITARPLGSSGTSTSRGPPGALT